jgi:hypothetical protein
MGLFSKFLLAGRKSLNSFMCGSGARAAAGTRGRKGFPWNAVSLKIAWSADR